MNNKVSDLIVKTRLYYYLSDIIGKKRRRKFLPQLMFLIKN